MTDVFEMIAGQAVEPNCFARHMGLWFAEPRWLCETVGLMQAGTFEAAIRRRPPAGDPPDAVDPSGIAVFSINGPMMKADSKYGGTNTVALRQAIRSARVNPDVKAGLLHIDSPGGTVSGTGELATDIRNFGKEKPIYAHVEDMCASAAYYVAAQTKRITATASSDIGSIGTIAVVEDSSEAASLAGVKVHVIASGERKGDFVGGAPVSDESLDVLQTEVNEHAAMFVSAVAKGRGMSVGDVRALADGSTMMAAPAVKAGLIDAVATVDQAVDWIRKDLRDSERASERAARGARSRSMRLAEVEG